MNSKDTSRLFYDHAILNSVTIIALDRKEHATVNHKIRLAWLIPDGYHT